MKKVHRFLLLAIFALCANDARCAVALGMQWLSTDLDPSQALAAVKSKNFEQILAGASALSFQFRDPVTQNTILVRTEFASDTGNLVRVSFTDESQNFQKQYESWQRLLGLPNTVTQRDDRKATYYCFSRSIGIILAVDSTKAQLGYLHEASGVKGCEKSLAVRDGSAIAYYGDSNRPSATDGTRKASTDVLAQTYRAIVIDPKTLIVSLFGQNISIGPQGGTLIRAIDSDSEEDEKLFKRRNVTLFYMFPEFGDARCIASFDYRFPENQKQLLGTHEDSASFTAALFWWRLTRGSQEQGPVYGESMAKPVVDQLKAAKVIVSSPLLGGTAGRAEFSLKRSANTREPLTRSSYSLGGRYTTSRSEHRYVKASSMDGLSAVYDCKTLQTANSDEAIKRMLVSLPESMLRR